MNWHLKAFNELSLDQLYLLLKLRNDIFIVEQDCAYGDIDDLDRLADCRHLLCFDGDTLAAYVRLLPMGSSYDQQCSIGRVIVHADYRSTGLGHRLMERAIKECQQLWPAQLIKIGAQSHLQNFYQRHGFVTISDEYLEDGIPHVHMLRDA